MNRMIKTLTITAIMLFVSSIAFGQVTPKNVSHKAQGKTPPPKSELQTAEQAQSSALKKPDFNQSSKATTIFSEDFSSQSIPSNFTLYNQDGLTPASQVDYVTNAWIANPNLNDSTDYTALSTSYYDPKGAADDWMVLPKISNLPIGTILKWNAVTYDSNYPDGYQILVSTTDSTVSSFTDTIYSISAEQSAWTNRSISLNAYTGQDIFIAFRNNSYDKFLLAIDDIEVFQPDPYEIGVTDIMKPNNDSTCTLTANENVKITVENFGSDSITGGFDVSYMINNGTPVTETITDTLTPGQTMNYTFNNQADLSSYQTYDFKAYTSFPQDTMQQNDTAYTSVKSADAPISIKIHTDDFPSETSWELYNSANQVIATSPSYSTSDSVYTTNICAISSNCYRLKIMDDYGDGIMNPGGYEVYFDSTLVDSSYSFNSDVAMVYHIGNGCASNDLQTDGIYTLGKLPKNAGSPHHVKAIISNMGTAKQTNAEVYLDITGSNTFQDTVTIADINSLETDTINFGGFTPNNLGTNNVNVSVASDQNNANNSLDYRQEITTDTYNHADTSEIDRSTGFNTNSGIMVSRYHVNGTKAVKSVRVNVSGSAAANQLYGVVLDSNGNILTSGNPVTINPTDTNSYINLPVIPFNAKDEDIYAGFAQVANSSNGYYPLNSQAEDPGRPDAFYYVTGLSGGALTEAPTFGRWMIEGVIMNPIAKDAVMAKISEINTACNMAYKNVEIQVYNNGTDTINSVEATYTVNNGSPRTDTINTAIHPGDTLYYTFTDSIDASSFQKYELDAYVNLPQDTIAGNDTARSEFYNVESSDIPYNTGFEASDDNYAWHFIDGNDDGTAPEAIKEPSAAHKGSYFINVPSGSIKQDEYVISTCLNLEAGKTYELKYWHMVGSFFGQPIPEDVKIMIGNSPNPSSMTTLLADLGSVDVTSFTKDAHNFQVNSNGIYHIGFHITTDGGFFYRLDNFAITDVTSIEEQKQSQFEIYPNPTSNRLNINGETNIEQVNVYNTMGQIIQRENTNTKRMELNVADYEPGVYFIRLMTEEGVVTKKFQVN